MKLDEICAAVIKRGYIEEKEYEFVMDNGELEKLNIKDSKTGEVEGIWIFPLEKSDVTGQKFKFVFFNDPLMFLHLGHPIGGLVGIATSAGGNLRASATSDECRPLIDAGAPGMQAELEKMGKDEPG